MSIGRKRKTGILFFIACPIFMLSYIYMKLLQQQVNGFNTSMKERDRNHNVIKLTVHLPLLSNSLSETDISILVTRFVQAACFF